MNSSLTEVTFLGFDIQKATVYSWYPVANIGYGADIDFHSHPISHTVDSPF